MLGVSKKKRLLNMLMTRFSCDLGGPHDRVSDTIMHVTLNTNNVVVVEDILNACGCMSWCQQLFLVLHLMLIIFTSLEIVLH